MIKRLALAGIVACLAVLVLAATALAVSINWGAASNPIYDEQGVGNTVLANGDIVQLIWDQGVDGADPPGVGGYPTGDDVLLNSSTIGMGSFLPGRFSKNINTIQVGSGSKVYVRAWNAGSLSSATYYGDSPILTINSDLAFTLDATAGGSFATTSPKSTTAVTLAAFVAIGAEGKVLVQWQTASETNMIGFNIYRSEDPDGAVQASFTKLNEKLIPSQAVSPMLGASYEYVDTSVQPLVIYYYWLEEMDVSGTGSLHGPVSAGSSGHRLYLPRLARP